MKDLLERQRAMETMWQRWWWLAGSGVLVVGVPLAGLALFPGSSFWTSFMAVVLPVWVIALVIFAIRHRKALAALRNAEASETLEDEYGRDSIQRGSSLAYAVTAALLFAMPLIHYYLTPLSVFVVCWVPLMAGTAVQAFYIHRRLA